MTHVWGREKVAQDILSRGKGQRKNGLKVVLPIRGWAKFVRSEPTPKLKKVVKRGKKRDEIPLSED